MTSTITLQRRSGFSTNSWILALFIIFFFRPTISTADLPEKLPPRVEQGPSPEWVITHPPLQPNHIPIEEIQDGTYFHDIDWQVMVKNEQPVKYYRYYREQIVNEAGLDTAAKINLTFDPSYQSLKLHQLNIHRDGTVIPKLDDAEIQLLRRETQLESMLYDGRYTATVVVSDLRVGDVIETAYTITGDNPIFNGRFSYRLPVSWGNPVGRLNFILHWPKDRHLFHKSNNTPFTFTKKESKDHVIYSLSGKRLKPYRANTQAPSWHHPYGEVFISEMQSWSDVIEWALPLYETAYKPDIQVADLARKIRQAHDSDHERLMAVLHHMQNKIRYLGIEAGVNSHRPSPPGETLTRRFGDCKDKSVAMIALLMALNIDARPVLVNTDIIRDPGLLLPSQKSFDHVIVRVSLGDEQYWLDPSRNYQGTELRQVFQPDYGYVLVIAPGNNGLTMMPDNIHLVGMDITEQFDLAGADKTRVAYTVSSAYWGLDAEKIRRQIAEQGLQELQNTYLDFYRKYYPHIRPQAPIEVKCLDTCNELKTIERYHVEQFWKDDGNGQRSMAEFYTNALYSHLKKPDQRERQDPYTISHPVDIKQSILVEILESMSVDAFNFSEENEFFIFYATASQGRPKSMMRLSYHYRSLTDSVPAAQIGTYMAAIDRVNKNLDYRLFDQETEQISEDENLRQANLILILIGLLVLAMAYIFVEWIVDIRKNRKDTELAYFPVSHVKFAILSMVTLGLYQFYWFYKQWVYVRDRDDSSIMPFFRAIFLPLWFYALYLELKKDSLERFGRSRLPGAPIIVLLLILLIAFNFLGYSNTIVGFAEYLSFLCLMPFANYVVYINRKSKQALAANSRFRPRHYILSTLMSFVLIYTFLSTIHWIPSANVVSGSDLPSWTIRFMQRQGLVDSADDLVYFYSDAYWSNKDDGNGVTKDSVFSYWRDEQTGNLKVHEVSYTDIVNIKINRGDSNFDNTTITVISSSGDEFILYLPKDDGMDQQVVNEIKRHINQAN